MKLNWAEDHITISSQNLERCTAQIEATLKNSRAKSLSDTESKELVVGSSKLRALEVNCRLIGKEVPARADAVSYTHLTLPTILLV